jgi:DNA-binding PadR family transcriptional regulator
VTRRPSPQTLRLLAALAAQPRAWRHGYGLSREAGLKAGTLYPMLTRLAERGLLELRWVDSPMAGRPPRHVCRLSSHGLSLARAALALEARAEGAVALAVPARTARSPSGPGTSG